MMLRTEFALHERVVLLALPASGFAHSVVDSSRMRLALGAAAHLGSGLARRIDARRAIFAAAERVDLDDLVLAMRRRGLVDLMTDVNFMLRAKHAYRADPAARQSLLAETLTALSEQVPDPAVATGVLLLDGTQQAHQIPRLQADIRAAIERWRAHDPSLADELEVYDVLRSLS